MTAICIYIYIRIWRLSMVEKYTPINTKVLGGKCKLNNNQDEIRNKINTNSCSKYYNISNSNRLFKLFIHR